MKLLSTAVLAVALLGLPGLALASEAPEALEPTTVETTVAVESTEMSSTVVEDQSEDLYGVLLFEDSVISEMSKAGTQSAAGCSAITRCYSGLTISCSGTSFCWTEPKCFVICDGNMTRCNSPCP